VVEVENVSRYLRSVVSHVALAGLALGALLVTMGLEELTRWGS
jgi:hypothetical protein